MRDRVTARDVVRREFVGVSEGDPVTGAAELMYEDRSEIAVVLRGENAVGALTAEDVLGLFAEGDDPETTTVGEVMREPVVSIAADLPLADAIATLADRDVRQLVVTDDDGVLGVLSAHDILTARAVLPESEGPETPRAAVGSAIDPEAENRTEDPYNTQGVCEVCGTFTGELRDVNGQLLCGDCRTV